MSTSVVIPWAEQLVLVTAGLASDIQLPNKFGVIFFDNE